jgi:hypothetical protein
MKTKKILIALLSLAVITIAVPTACQPPVSSAQFEITSLDITPAEVAVGETARVSAQIKNIGRAVGVYSAILSVDGETIDRKEINVAPGSAQTLTFSLSKDKVGTYEIGIGQSEVGIGQKSATLTVKSKLVAKQVELKYDTGQAKDCISLVKPATGFLVGFVSPPDPFTITSIRVFGLVYGSPGYQTVSSDLQIWDKDQKVLYTAPFPGNKFPLRSRLGDNIDSTGGWAEVEIPNVQINGAFYIQVYTGIATGQGFRMGADDKVVNTHSDVTVRGSSGVDSLVPTWPYSIARWYGYKGSVNWMVRVAGNAMSPQE